MHTPTGLYVYAGYGATQIDLTWTDGSTSEVNFSVQRREKAPAGVYTSWARIVQPAVDFGTWRLPTGLRT